MLPSQLIRAVAAALLALAAVAASAQTPAKPRIEKAADLPRFSYKIDARLEDVVRQADRFAPVVAAIRRDTESVLAGYDIPDRATRRGLVTQLAIMDFLDAQYDRALARLDEARALEDKPADKLMSGLRLRAMANAAKAHPLNSEAYRKAVADSVARELAGMPFAVVANDVREIKMSAELIGEALILGSVREVMQPIVDKGGSLSSDFAPGLVGARYRLVAQLPLKQTFVDSFSAYLSANQIAKADIWAARDVTLRPDDGGRNVRVAVWDSGVDTALFGTQVQRDKAGAPLVIGFDKFSRPARHELMPIPRARCKPSCRRWWHAPRASPICSPTSTAPRRARSRPSCRAWRLRSTRRPSKSSAWPAATRTARMWSASRWPATRRRAWWWAASSSSTP